MKPFPWGLLTLALFALDLLLTVFYILRKRMARRMLRRMIAKGKLKDASLWLMEARSKRLIRPVEYQAWQKEFGLEDK
jgi:hypothetical protein